MDHCITRTLSPSSTCLALPDPRHKLAGPDSLGSSMDSWGKYNRHVSLVARPPSNANASCGTFRVHIVARAGLRSVSRKLHHSPHSNAPALGSSATEPPPAWTTPSRPAPALRTLPATPVLGIRDPRQHGRTSIGERPTLPTDAQTSKRKLGASEEPAIQGRENYNFGAEPNEPGVKHYLVKNEGSCGLEAKHPS